MSEHPNNGSVGSNLQNDGIDYGGHDFFGTGISTRPDPCDMIEETGHREDEAVSFVGIMFNDNGIVGFADSRNTETVNGIPHLLDDDTTKIFKTENFITVTWGANTVMRGSFPVPIQDILMLRANGFPGTHREFAELIKDDLKDTFYVSPGAEYCFLFGFTEDAYGHAYHGIEECIITRPGIQYKNLEYGHGIRFAGSYDCAPRNITVQQSWTVPEMEKRCRALVQSVITLGDAFMVYNPVGGEIRTETLY